MGLGHAFGQTTASAIFPLTFAMALSLSACTANKSNSNLAQTAAVATQQSASLNSEKAVPGPSANVACSNDEVGLFDKQDGTVVDLDRDTLPNGMFLASNIEMLIEKKNDDTTTSRVLMREAVAGKNAEIVCSEGVDKFGSDFEMALSGLAKFETADKVPPSGFVLRQFFFFQNKTGHGLVVSNPGMPNSASDLKKILQHHGPAQLVRLGEKSYELKYLRERDGVRARMLIHLDVI